MSNAKPSGLLSHVIKNMTWNFYGSHRNIYLTFDDGPTPVVTKHVLDLLDEFGARATFFCLGRNVDKYPELYRQIITSGHAVGNHSYSHIKGFRSSNRHYLDDIELADNLIHSRLFRPPYGQIFPWQAREVIHNYRIIMWDILSFDYNSSLTGTRVVRNVISKVRPGSIIVFHDSEKARKNLYAALPEVLGFLKENHYNMELIPENGK